MASEAIFLADWLRLILVFASRSTSENEYEPIEVGPEDEPPDLRCRPGENGGFMTFAHYEILFWSIVGFAAVLLIINIVQSFRKGRSLVPDIGALVVIALTVGCAMVLFSPEGPSRHRPTLRLQHVGDLDVSHSGYLQ